MYVSSLISLIDGYIEARKVNQLDELRNLLVSDRLKIALKRAVLRYVLSVEARSDKGWLEPYVLAEVVDDYTANYHDPAAPKSGVLGMVGQTCGSKPLPKAQGNRQFSVGAHDNVKTFTAGIAQKGEVKKSQLMCWHCGGPHLVRFCTENRNTSNTLPKTGNTTGRVSKAAIVPNIVNEIPGFSPDPGHKTSQSSPVCPTADCVNMIDHVTTDEQDVVVQCCADDNNSVNRTAVDYVNAICETDDDCMITESVKHPLSYFVVDVALPNTPNVCVSAKALNDSGSECALICQSVLQRVEQSDPVVPIGKVKISGICGDSVVCPLIRLKDDMQ